VTPQTAAISTPVLALVGPTAIGKTALSLQLAQEFNCEIVSVDSMQVYKYMDIGTAKIGSHEMKGIPHHLIDIVFPDEEYDAARFVIDATEAIRTIAGKGRMPLLTGGTGLYLKALTEGLFADIPTNINIRDNLKERADREGVSKLHEELRICDPESARRIHPNDTARILRGLEIFLATGTPWSSYLRTQKLHDKGGKIKNILQLALTCDRELLYNRINLRAQLMLEQGLEEEVRELLSMGYDRRLKSMNSIGYRHMLNYLEGLWSVDEMLELLRRDTRRYAKRQYTWFNGISGMEWFDVVHHDAIRQRIAGWLSA